MNGRSLRSQIFGRSCGTSRQIESSRSYNSVLEDIRRFPGARWFNGARLNYAQNLLRFRDDKPALVFRGEGERAAAISHAELYELVGRLADSLRSMGVRPGDRVVAYMPNLIETAIAMLATTSIGAVWSSCATDIGPAAALERLGQVGPKVLFTVDGYVYKGRIFETLPAAAQLARGMPSLQRVVVVPFVGLVADLDSIPAAVLWQDFLPSEPVEPVFEQLPFDHPLFIMFSSGTTGKPKCMVQGAGRRADQSSQGTPAAYRSNARRSHPVHHLLQLDDVELAAQLPGRRRHRRALRWKPHIIPDPGAMWSLIDEERITIFGCSASYLLFLNKEGYLAAHALRLALPPRDLADRLAAFRRRLRVCLP